MGARAVAGSLRSFALLLLLLAAGLAAGPARAGDCDSLDRSVLTTPMPETSVYRVRRHMQTVAAAPGDAEAVIIGDSLVENWPQDALDRAVGTRVVKFGSGGDAIQNILWRMQDVARKEAGAKLVMLWAGTGNLTYGVPACAVAEGVLNLVQDARAHWPQARIVLLGLVLRGSFAPLREEVNELVSEQRLRLGFGYVDVAGLLGCHDLGATAAYVLGLAVQPQCPYLQWDGSHLNADGYGRLSAAIADMFH